MLYFDSSPHTARNSLVATQPANYGLENSIHQITHQLWRTNQNDPFNGYIIHRRLMPPMKEKVSNDVHHQ